jgi:hypothetical protein
MVQVAGFILVVFFGWLKLEGVPIGPALGSMSADVLVKIALVIFYVSWSFGLLNDTSEQQLVYASVPDEGRVPSWAYVVGVVITGLFAVLCVVETSQQFAIVLAVFLFANIVSWRYHVRKIVRKSYSASRSQFVQSGDQASLLSLETVYAYHSGKWQWHRFICGGMLVMCLLIVAFSDVGGKIAALVYPIPNETVAALVVLLYVLTMEVWIWIIRVRVKLALDTIAKLSSRFRFVPIDDA